MASTGVAAVNLPNGKTAHSFFGIPVEDLTTHSISKHFNDAEKSKKVKEKLIIFWDEVSMVHKNQFNVVDKFLKHVHSTDKPFGGIKIVLMGDFRQILPITKGATSAIIKS